MPLPSTRRLPNAYFNLSHAYKALNRLEEAEQAARQAVALRPENADYHFHLAHVLLLQGDLQAGWEEYEWRWKLPNFAAINTLRSGLSKPEWRGEDLSGKSILVYTEQGLGDIIQFARYLKLLACKARRVIVAAYPPAHRLLQTIDGNHEWFRWPRRPGRISTASCALMSLPRACATRLDSIPAAIPYLHADKAEQARWAQRIGGQAFAGRHRLGRQSGDAAGSLPLAGPGQRGAAILRARRGFRDLAEGAGALRSSRRIPLPSHVLDLGDEIGDLTDTAAIMSGLDLVISSCTGPLHLAGALGVPVWAMIPFAPHFPWLLERTDTLWYPTMRLYRQEQPGRDWAETVSRIAADLAILARSKG